MIKFYPDCVIDYNFNLGSSLFRFSVPYLFVWLPVFKCLVTLPMTFRYSLYTPRHQCTNITTFNTYWSYTLLCNFWYLQGDDGTVVNFWHNFNALISGAEVGLFYVWSAIAPQFCMEVKRVENFKEIISDVINFYKLHFLPNMLLMSRENEKE